MLYIAGIFFSLFLAALLFTKKDKTHADVVLACWMTLMGIHLLDHYIFISGKYVQFPVVVTIGFALPLLHSPFLFLYTILQTTSGKLKAIHGLHLIPFAVSLLIFSPFFLLSHAEQVQVLETKGEGFRLQLFANLCMIAASGIVYITLSLVRLLRYRRNMVHQFSNTDKINFNWLLYLILWMIVIWVIIIFIGGDKIIFSAVSVFILWLGYFGIKQVPVFHQNVSLSAIEQQVPAEESISEKLVGQTEIPLAAVAETVKYQKSNLSEESANDIHERLKLLMEVAKPFRNPDLTLNELAKSLDVHPNHLSQVINSKENKNFYDLVNEHRSAEFIRMVSENANAQFTLLGIALDCGFNSKASFNRNFKKYTGLAPREYVKKLEVV